MRIILSLTTILLFFSCNNLQNKNLLQNIPNNNNSPQIVKLNIKGYSVNPITNDTIKPIINNLGDTVKTGIFIPVNKKLLTQKPLINLKYLNYKLIKYIPLNQIITIFLKT